MIFTKGKRVCLPAFILAILVAAPADALEVKGLYEIELIANSQSAADREQAIKQALYGVLSRVLVADDISKLPAVQQVLNGAQHYVKQFQYSLIAADQYSGNDARLIRVEFDEDQLLEVMRKSQVGIWSEIRPETLVWLVVDAEGKRQFYNPETMPDFESAMALASKIKGVPVIFPMLDLEEQQRISVSEVLGADSRNLLAVSARYEVPAVMAGRVTQKGQCWQGDWAFYFDSKIKQWSSDCLPLKATIQDGMRGAYSILSNYYGVKPKQE
ncbi:MAG: DUF2066 domain-containing protein [Methylomonas sp.]|jgi:hypothetical protein|uniref:DUF2066 domain-containing protein n=1 Tax=Methylomonas sp. TaxID=418 RepID=UPI0025F95125|nr:DUF2066 domain-containing protein [Methylomonas sp.]MCK9608360.1 DUF2066 domain-containing protein [Methylomonas sp.]